MQETVCFRKLWVSCFGLGVFLSYFDLYTASDVCIERPLIMNKAQFMH